MSLLKNCRQLLLDRHSHVTTFVHALYKVSASAKSAKHHGEDNKYTHFGYESVKISEKSKRGRCFNYKYNKNVSVKIQQPLSILIKKILFE